MLEMLDEMIANALQSDFFAGGLALGAFGVAVATLRVLYMTVYRVVQRRIWVSLTLDNRTSAYRNFNLWMDDTGVLDKSKHVRMTDNRWASGTKGYAPAPGRHWFIRNGKVCHLTRRINDKAKVGAAHNSAPMETLTVTVLFGRVATILGWIDAGRKLAQGKDRAGPGLHLLKGDYWESLGDIAGRAVDTVLVDDDRVDQVLKDMRWFYAARDWYADRGVPWRRGYLLFGPPGTGKSSLIRALATELRLDIASLDVGRMGLTDDDLREAMMCAPKGALIAIEDIDAIFVQRDGGEKRTGVSFSGLLNAIDGVAAQEGRALVMTTNHKAQLDPALIRPGRADVHLELGLVNAATAARLFDRFFPNEAKLSTEFCRALGAASNSPAAIQGWLLSQSDDAKVAATAAGLSNDAVDFCPPLLAASGR